jgi:hypothetical protein
MSTVATIQMQTNSGGARNSTTALPDHDRQYGFIQNIGTNILYVKMGLGCTTTDYDYILEASDSGAGNGGIAEFDYDGVVTVAGTSPSYTAFER